MAEHGARCASFGAAFRAGAARAQPRHPGARRGCRLEYLASHLSRLPPSPDADTMTCLAGPAPPAPCSVARAGELDAVYLWPRAHCWTPTRHALLGMARLVGLRSSSSERAPWTLSAGQTWMEPHVSPLSGIDGVVAISSFLASWVVTESRRMAGRPSHRSTHPRRPTRADSFAVPDRHSPGALRGLPGLPQHRRVHPRGDETRMGPSSRLPPGDHGHRSRRGEGTLAAPPARSHRDGRARGATRPLPRAELLDLYHEASVLLAPLFEDTQSVARFPTKIGEYLAAGRPVSPTQWERSRGTSMTA